MQQAQHTIGFYMIETSRLQEEIKKSFTKLMNCPYDFQQKKRIYREITMLELESSSIRKQLYKSVQKKKIDILEHIAFFKHNKEQKLQSLLAKLRLERTK